MNEYQKSKNNHTGKHGWPMERGFNYVIVKGGNTVA